MSADNKDPKATDSGYINLKVVDQDHSTVLIKIKKHVRLGKLMAAYCKRMELLPTTVKFRFDGYPIADSDTPLSLEMEEGDAIEVYQNQTGGAPLTQFLNHF